MDGLARAMDSAAKLGAAYEKQNHSYVSRTGTLSRSTQGKLVRASRSELRAELVALAPYASFVNRKGLMVINSASVRVRDAIQDYISSNILKA